MNTSESEIIKKNIIELRKKVAEAALKSNRNPEDIKIIAVTKTVEPERIAMAVNEGIYDLGENRVQELCEKYDKINKECNWHLIGHLQKNKVKYIVDKVKMIHSLDSISLANEIQKRAERINRVIDVLVQVNVANEPSKYGISCNEAIDFIKELSSLSNIKVKGLMTIAPLAENQENVRWVFRELRNLYIDISKENIHNIDMEYLSMGMSNDYQVAIEEGSNMVRIGTAIFGPRQ
ncbi:MAG TPA: YggS family pyridoxal phosphate-dependent enzyme [Clostridiaceae bacterium]|nr:YggS family pyridoxal phosphate-dependent enzyme [Clostridiaceae bacterium]